jgi:hypothetical protein
VADDDSAPRMPENRDRLLERLDHLVRSGQVTAEEAADLRSTNNLEDYEAAVARIRTRHARVRLDAAVEAGQRHRRRRTATSSCCRTASILVVSERTYARSPRKTTEAKRPTSEEPFP